MFKIFFIALCWLGVWQSCLASEIKPIPVERCPKPDVEIPLPDSSPDHAAHMTEILRQQNAPKIVYALGRPVALEALLSQGENPNVCVLGGSLLAISTEGGHLKEVQMLIKGGAHPDKPIDYTGGTPLMAALLSSHYDVALYLLEHGANPRHLTDGSATTLHEFALGATATLNRKTSSMQLKIARQLIDSGVSVNAQTSGSKATALMYAALKNNKPLVSLLIESGADVNLVSARGDTALTHAQKRGYTEIIEILKKAGAKDPPPSAK